MDLHLHGLHIFRLHCVGFVGRLLSLGQPLLSVADVESNRRKDEKNSNDDAGNDDGRGARTDIFFGRRRKCGVGVEAGSASALPRLQTVCVLRIWTTSEKRVGDGERVAKRRGHDQNRRRNAEDIAFCHGKEGEARNKRHWNARAADEGRYQYMYAGSRIRCGPEMHAHQTGLG